MSAEISIISASAGSGKTTEIVRRLIDKLDAEDPGRAVAPEAVIATTFTRKAARELETRVARELYARGRFDYAARMGEAKIGTVHSIAGELLEEYAFELGLVPGLEVIPEEDGNALFAESLGEVLSSADAERMTRLAARLGLGENRPGGGGSDWRGEVRRVAETARTNAVSAAELARHAAQSAAELRGFLDSPAPSGEELQAAVAARIDRVLRAGPAADDDTKTTREAFDTLRRLRAGFTAGDVPPWTDWIKLSRLSPGAKTREAFEPLAEAASAYMRHPEFAGDLEALITLTFSLAARLLDSYQEFKRRRGLIDFADQERLLLDALDREDVARSLAERFDLLLVDEFQDTNPIQLAVFLKLARVADEVIWVGDPKQSIYGFRDADPELMEAALREIGTPSGVLSTSYRSRPGVVAFTNAVFAEAFAGGHGGAGGTYRQIDVEVTPHRSEESPAMDAAVRFWKLIPSGGAGKEAAARGTARAVGSFLGKEHVIYDPAERLTRPARPGDIAVLARTGADVERLTTALQREGLRAAAERGGLRATPEATVLLAALRYLADPRDSLAEAEIRLLAAAEPRAEAVLRSRLAALGEERDWPEPSKEIERLSALRAAAGGMPLPELVDAVVARIDLHRLVLRFGEAASRRANIEKIRELAVRYEDWCRRFARAPSAAGFVLWLNEQPDDLVDRQGAGRGPDAVNVLTYHGAKGLEWPVVVAFGLEREPAVSSFGLSVIQDAAFDLSRPLANRRLRYWPEVGGRRARNELRDRVEAAPALDAEREAQHTEELRLLYVGLTRARDYLILPIPRSGGKAKPRYRPAWLEATLGEELSLPEDDGETTLSLRGRPVRAMVESIVPSEEPSTEPASAAEEARGETGRWLTPSAGATEHEPYYITPSDSGGPRDTETTASLQVEARLDYAEPIEPPAGVDPLTLGDALHAVYCSYCRRGGLSAAEAARVLERYGVPAAFPPSGVVERVRATLTRLEEHHAPEHVLAEAPLHLAAGGRLMNGSADLLLLSSRETVLVDHKVVRASPEQLDDEVPRYANQLGWYARALGAAFGPPAAVDSRGPAAVNSRGPAGSPALVCYLNFPLQGRLLRVRGGGEIAR